MPGNARGRSPVTESGPNNWTIPTLRIPAPRSAPPEMHPYRIGDLPEPIAANVTIDGASGCWVVGPGNGIRIDKDGYARWRGQLVHRLAYAELIGEIPADRPVIDHVLKNGCVRRNCANVNGHLEPVTAKTNTLRGSSFSAVNFAKDECIHGHPFDLLGTYFRPNGHRDCRVCIRVRVARYRRRKRQRAAVTALAPAAELGRAA